MAKNAATGLYEPRPARQIAKRLAGVMPSPGGLQAVANALNKGDFARAQIAALHLKLPPFQPEMLRRVAKSGYDPNEPRDNHGRWTNGGGDEDSTDSPATPRLNPAVYYPDETPAMYTEASDRPPTRINVGHRKRPPADNPISAMKQHFVDAHLADAQKAADELGVPVENILGISALESNWGKHRFAAEGNNYFGIHYPAPFANGYILTLDGKTKMAKFENYGNGAQSFIAETRSIVQNKSDPTAFVTALQNSGKFGINPKIGRKKSRLCFIDSKYNSKTSFIHFNKAIQMIRISINFLYALMVIFISEKANAETTSVPWKIDDEKSQIMAAAANEGSMHDLKSYTYDFTNIIDNNGNKTTVDDSNYHDRDNEPRYFSSRKAFLMVDGPGPIDDVFDFYMVNAWTGDVWAMSSCKQISTPASRKMQAAIKARFTAEELKQYKRLSEIKPQCAIGSAKDK